MKTIRILALHLAYGGVEKAICSMANLFVQRYPVEIISVYDMPNAPAYPLDERVKVRYLLKDRPNQKEWRAALRGLRPISFLRESIRAVKILLGKRRAVRRTIRSIHDGILITTRHEDNLVLSLLGDPKVWKIAQVHEDHCFNLRYLDGFRHGYSGLDVVVMLTPGLAQEVRQWIPAGAKTRVVSVPNFLEHFPEPFPLEEKEKRIVAVGRLSWEKGFDRLLDCFAMTREKHPDWSLHIVGDGPEQEKLEQKIAELGLEGAAVLTGRLAPAGVEEEMKRASLYAMTSVSEGFPFVLLEALSCGLPTVAYDVRVGPAAVLRPGLDGVLIPDGDREAYAASLMELMEDDARRLEMAREALLHARDFSREKVAGIWDTVLEP